MSPLAWSLFAVTALLSATTVVAYRPLCLEEMQGERPSDDDTKTFEAILDGDWVDIPNLCVPPRSTGGTLDGQLLQVCPAPNAIYGEPPIIQSPKEGLAKRIKCPRCKGAYLTVTEYCGALLPPPPSQVQSARG